MPEDKKVADNGIEVDAGRKARLDAEALAEARADAEAHPRDETVEGGKYKVGDDFVDAEGKPFKKKSE